MICLYDLSFFSANQNPGCNLIFIMEGETGLDNRKPEEFK
jgi:hypothetical protein